jgi:hypothetical protein
MIVSLLFAAGSFAWSQGSSVSSSQLKLPLSARSAALGEGTVTDPGQLSSWALNPANLYSSAPMALMITHSQWIQGIQTEGMGARIPLFGGAFGVGVWSNSVPGIEIRDVPGPAIGTFSARFSVFQAGYADDVTNDFTLGASVKYIYEKLYVNEATGYGFDIGMLYRTPLSGLNAGFAVTNLGSLRQLQDERSDLPTFVRPGVSYYFQEQDFEFMAAGAWSANVHSPESHLQLSLESTYHQQISLSFGYQTGYETRALSAGIGIRINPIQLDYAFVPFSLGLGDSHLFSLGFQF